MLSRFSDSFEKYPSYQLCSLYHTYDNLHFYNPKSEKINEKADKVALKNARTKTALDIKSKSMLVENANLNRKEDDEGDLKNYISSLKTDRVSMNREAPPAVGEGLANNKKVKMHVETSGGRTKKHKKSSVYDYLL